MGQNAINKLTQASVNWKSNGVNTKSANVKYGYISEH